MPESALHAAWRRADGSRASLTTADGRCYRVLYSGMPGGSIGPDFRDAVFESEDGSELHGDVEIHRDAADWYAHGHHTDDRYGRVIFHAVCALSRDHRRTVNSLGMNVAEIGIAPLIDGDDAARLVTQNHEGGDTESDNAADGWLDEAGDEWFAQRMASRRLDIERFGPDLALQMSIFEALGYPRNREQFRLLAQRLPWAFLARFSHRNDLGEALESAPDSDVRRANAVLRWAAGFDARPEWCPVPRLFGETPQWQRAGTRPSNRPEARVSAAAHLVARWWRDGGPLRSTVDMVTASIRASDLRAAYQIGDGVLGRGRAGEIVVNAVLPTVAAWAQIGGDGVLYRKTMHLYRQHPSLSTNSILREATRVMFKRRAPIEELTGARRQLGAMHIYRTMLLRPRSASQINLGRRVLSS